MQVTVEDVSSVKKILHIEIPEDEVARELESAYRELKKTAKIKGFRPGKVPRSVLERRFKKDVHADVSGRLIQSSFVDAIKETALNIIGQPRVDPPEVAERGPYRYDATVEVRPEIGDIDFKGLKLKKKHYDISEQEIDAQLRALQDNLARLKPVEEDRALAQDDFALIDYEGFEDGQPFEETQKTENFTFKVGDGPIHASFDEGLVGMRPGERREVAVDFPPDYANPKLAGRKITFQVRLNEIREKELPPIDDAMAKKLGKFKNLDELRAQIVSNLEQGYAKRTDQELNEQVFKHLIGEHPFEVPETLVEMELQNIVNDAERSFQYHNMSMEDAGLTREGLAEQYRDTAVRQVKRHLILSRIVEQEKLELGEEELAQGFDDMGASLQQPAEQIKNYYEENPDKLDYFKQALLEKKAVKLIISSGDIEAVTVAAEKAAEEKTG